MFRLVADGHALSLDCCGVPLDVLAMVEDFLGFRLTVEHVLRFSYTKLMSRTSGDERAPC